MEKTDRACFNVVDRQGRTGLHYAAALSEYDDIGMYGWLMNMGYDKTPTDNVRKYSKLVGRRVWVEKNSTWKPKPKLLTTSSALP